MTLSRYLAAHEEYNAVGVNTEAALKILSATPISIHCWQGDDVAGFERAGAKLSGGGIQATGNYAGKARSPEELRLDLDKAFSLIPGRHRVNLHAIYGDFCGRIVDRNAVTPAHFQVWIDWAKSRDLGLDFNPTFFSHPLADDGATLSHASEEVRNFWIDHGVACRRIAEAMGMALGSPCITNFWIPDGQKDLPVDRSSPRERLKASLDAIFAEALDERFQKDALESKLFGIGSESYVVGSHEFYYGYAVERKKLLCLDMGHFHPTESVADKLSAVKQFVPGLLLHVSRGVRWDSDHVALFDDSTRSLFEELVRSDLLQNTAIGLDYFDASINRVAAWVIGSRNTLKGLLFALLQPLDRLRTMENAADYTGRLALLEDVKTLPFGAIWDEYCRRSNVAPDRAWMPTIQTYERNVLSLRK